MRSLGQAGDCVSVLSLGSWKTFERLSREDSLNIMRAARDAGINFLDDARYNDETGHAPIPTGYSEVLFGELFRSTWTHRDDALVANKLWWEFWPDQSASDELDGSLGRLRFDHVDLIYSLPPPAGVGMERVVESMSQLIDSGRARMWGVANWQAGDIVEAIEIADANAVVRPVVAQLPYSLIQREWVESPAMASVIESGVGLVASYSLAGGTLTGKYLRGEPGRATEPSDNPILESGKIAATELGWLADEWGVSAATLALAFALAHPQLTSVLFGATSEAQLLANLAAVDVLDSLDSEHLARLCAIGV
jgi:aryl-alcohol dehydrogenase-like predicted oxidoreductase